MTRLVNPNRVAGSIHDLSTLQTLGTDPCNVLFVSDQVKYILANYAIRDVKFYGRYADSWPNDDQAFVLRPSDAGAEFVDRLVEDFQLQVAGDDMDIANALNNIAVALQSAQACCDGPTTQGTGGASGQETTPSDGVDNGTVPPSTTDFPTYTEYQQYKCDVANFILDGADSTVNALQSVAWSSLFSLPVAEAVVVIAALTATPIPGDEIIAMMAFLTVWGGAFQPVFDNVELAIDNNRSSLICDLFEAPDVETAKTDYLDGLYLAIDGESTPGGLLNTVSKGVAKALVTFDNLNPLFTQQTGINYPAGTDDCTGCANVCDLFYATDGTIQLVNGLNVSTEAKDNGGTGKVTIWVNTNGSTPPNRAICAPALTFESVVLTSGVAGVLLFDDAQNLIGNYHTDPANGNLPQVTAGVRHISVQWNTGQGLPPAQASIVFS